ncbi:MAG: tRNA (adenosine(37)-N6)-threonylcarbamoyltransferase complex dimerization subunit type 1 TsaB [Bradymonadaceae bacterium]
MGESLALGIDTATPVQSIALMDGDRLIEDCRRRVEFDHSSSLLANLDDGFREHDWEPGDLDLIAVGIGPGSFTGVRIGLSLAKGIARGAEVPLVGVSSPGCQATSHARRSPGRYVCAAYDAQRREVYTGTFVHRRESDRTVPVVDDALVEPAELRARLERWADDEDRTITVVGNGTERFEELGRWDRPDIRALPPADATPSGVDAIRLGRQAFDERGPDDLARLEPNYIRPSSAEENDEDD